MPMNYADTSNIVDTQQADAADVKVPVDALDDKLHAVVTGSDTISPSVNVMKLPEQAADPAQIADTFQIFSRDDGKLYAMDGAGNKSDLLVGGGGGGSVADGSVTTSKLADDAVTLDKLAHGATDHYLGFDGSGAPAYKNIPWDAPGYIGGTTPNGGNFTAMVYQSADAAKDGTLFHGIKAYSNNQYESSILALHRARGTQASPSAVQANDRLCEIAIYGHDGSALQNRIKIVGTANENWSGSAQGAKLQFQVGGNGGTGFPGDSMVITGQDVHVAGSLSKGSGTFLIDHPLAPEQQDLYHGFVEAPRFDLIYRGQIALVDGEAEVSIDAASNMSEGTFAALTQNAQVWLQNQSGWDAVRGRVEDGTLVIESQNLASTDVIDWLVIAERADAFIQSLETTNEVGQLIPEQLKPEPDGSETAVTEDDLSEIDYEIPAVALIGKRGYPRHSQALGIDKPLPKRTVRGKKQRQS